MGRSPYIVFSMEMRPKVVEENPKAKFGKIAKILGKMWKELPEEEKQKWVKKANEYNEQHKDE